MHENGNGKCLSALFSRLRKERIVFVFGETNGSFMELVMINEKLNRRSFDHMFLEVVRLLLRGVISFTGVPSGIALQESYYEREW